MGNNDTDSYSSSADDHTNSDDEVWNDVPEDLFQKDIFSAQALPDCSMATLFSPDLAKYISYKRQWISLATAICSSIFESDQCACSN